MAVDPVLMRELDTLRGEVAQAQQMRRANPAAPESAVHTHAPSHSQPATICKTCAVRSAASQARSRSFDEAEKNIAAHPAQSFIGALLVGILIGLLAAH